jgi:hypothetical protein
MKFSAMPFKCLFVLVIPMRPYGFPLATILKWVNIGSLSAAIVIGLVWCFVGYRLIKVILFTCVRQLF